MTNFQTYRPSLDEILNGTPLTPAEEKLLAACKSHGEVSLGYQLPTEETPNNNIRGEIISYLMMGGCKKNRPNAKGVSIYGGYITGLLHLTGCNTGLCLKLQFCDIKCVPVFEESSLAFLEFRGSRILGLHADSARFSGGIDLAGVVSSETIFLSGSTIDKGVNLASAELVPASGPALAADGVQVGGNVDFGEGFYASNTINFGGARIGGQLNLRDIYLDVRDNPSLEAHGLAVGDCLFIDENFTAEGDVDLHGAVIGGQLACSRGEFLGGLNLPAVRVGEDLCWSQVKAMEGHLNLRNTTIRVLSDDGESWGATQSVNLEGFTYEMLDSDLSVEERLNWLEQDSSDADLAYFSPQPHTQLAQYYQALVSVRQQRGCYMSGKDIWRERNGRGRMQSWMEPGAKPFDVRGRILCRCFAGSFRRSQALATNPCGRFTGRLRRWCLRCCISTLPGSTGRWCRIRILF